MPDSVRPRAGGHVVAVAAPLIALGSAPPRQLSAEAGFDHHLVKPVDIDSLMNILARS